MCALICMTTCARVCPRVLVHVYYLTEWADPHLHPKSRVSCAIVQCLAPLCVPTSLSHLWNLPTQVSASLSPTWADRTLTMEHCEQRGPRKDLGGNSMNTG